MFSYKSIKPQSHLQLFRLILLLIPILSGFLLNCKIPFFSDSLSGPFPYKFEREELLPKQGFFVDLDHDRLKEFIVLNKFEPEPGFSGILLYDDIFNLIHQQNFNGKFRYLIQFDWNNNGTDEIGFAFTNHDTSFFRIIDSKTKILKEKPIFWGKPRIDSTCTIPWQGNINDIRCVDLDNDGKKELIFFVSENYAAAPRGVIVLDAHTLEECWRYFIGPSIGETPIIHDFNNDGFKEILIPTVASSNGNVVDDTNDSNTYLIMLAHNSDRIKQKIYEKKYTTLSIQLINNPESKKKKIALIVSKPYPEEFKPEIRIIDPITQENIRPPVYFETSVKEFKQIQIDTDMKPEFIALERSGKMTLLDDDFTFLHSKQLPSTITNFYVCEDLNNDNEPEIFLCGNGTFWMDKNFNILAGTSRSLIFSFSRAPQIYYRYNERPLVLLSGQENTALFTFKKVPAYLLLYFAPRFGIVVVVLLPFFVFAYLIQIKNKNRYLNVLSERFLSLSSESIIVLDHKRRIKFINSKTYDFFNLPKTGKLLNIKLFEKNIPKLGGFFDELYSAPNIKHEKILEIDPNGGSSCRVTAEPVYYAGASKPFWLVIFEDTLLPSNLKNIKTWVGIAQKIAHDIKNPLNSIQLTLQRLQLEYNKDKPEKVKKYNRYTKNIIERIDALRHISRGFMKFINSEELNPQPTDLNAFIENLFNKSFIELPEDIQLIKNLNPDLPIIKIDRDQIQTLVENLISNAVNGMLEGGSLTIGTSLISNISFNNGNSGPQDYVAVEIMDTGRGIPADIQARLFRPYTTKSKLGTGLGLTIAKKIVDDHYGRIEIHSEAGVGTSVLVYLPV